MSDAFDIAELSRRLASLILYAVVLEVDAGAARLRVRDGEWESDWLPWLAGRAGGADASWSVPRVGERVLLLCPTGERAAAAVLSGIYCDDFPAPSDDPEVLLRQTHDGGSVEYNRSTSHLEVTVPEAGSARITAAGMTLIVQGGQVHLDAQNVRVVADQVVVESDDVKLGGGGGPGVARVGDLVDLQTGKIMEGSDVVSAV